MTGCSSAGKTTIATALEERLMWHYGKHVYQPTRRGQPLDQFEPRLGFSEAESVRRTGEMATLFADARESSPSWD